MVYRNVAQRSYCKLHACFSLTWSTKAGTIAVAGADASERRFGWTAVALAFVGILASPGALGGILHVLSISGEWATFVPELAPSWTWFQYESPYGFVAGTIPWLAVVLVIASALRQPPRAQWPTVLAAAGLAFGSVWMVRLTYYSVFVFILLHRDIQHYWSLLVARSERLDRSCNMLIGVVIVAVLTVLAWQRVPPTVKRGVNPWTTTLDPGYFPEAEVNLLKRAGVGTRIFNHTVWGGFILYHLYPQGRVLSDGRITFLNDVKDTLYHVQRRSRRLTTLKWARANWKIDLVVWPPGMMPENDMWERLIVGPTAEVWAPKGAVAVAYREALQRAGPYPP